MWPTFFIPVLYENISALEYEYSNEFLSPWLEEKDPRHPDGVYTHRLYTGGTGVWKSYEDALVDAAAAEGLDMDPNVYCWSLSNNEVGQPTYPQQYAFDPTPVERTIVLLKVNRYAVTDRPSVAVGFEAAAAPGDIFHVSGLLTPLNSWRAFVAIHAKMATTAIVVPPGYDGPDTSGLTSDGRRILFWYDENIECRREPGPPAGFTYDARTYKVLQKYEDFLPLGGTQYQRVVTKYPLNPARPIGHPEYDDSAFWTAAYNAAVAAGDMAAGLTYGVHYPVTQAYGYYKIVPA